MRKQPLQDYTIDGLLVLGQRVFQSFLEIDGVRPALATIGLDDAFFADGEAKLAAFRQSADTFTGLDADKLARTEEVVQAREALQDGAFGRHVGVAALAFEPPELSRLGLARRSVDMQRIDTFLLAAQSFYQGLLSDDAKAEAMSARGAPREELEATLVEVDAVIQRRNDRDALDAEKQQALKTRNTAREALESWIRTLREHAQVALRDTPQLLEPLGYTVA
jgi:hypothetical protein